MSVKREVLGLVILVLLVDAVFVAGYMVAGVARGTSGAKLAFTLVWTAVTLALVIRGLTRIRRARLQAARQASS